MQPVNEPFIQFRCASCGFEEAIPKSVVDFFDILDGGDPTFPPRFECQKCDGGLMQPLQYTNHDGITYIS